MLYLIDAYNLIFCAPIEAATLQEKRERLIALIAGFLNKKKCRCILVFDGNLNKSDLISRIHIGEIETVYTYKGETADDYIIDFVERSQHKKEITVVSSDNGILTKANALGTDSLKISQFIKNVTQNKIEKSVSEKPDYSTQTDNEKEYFTRLFEERYRKNQEKD